MKKNQILLLLCFLISFQNGFSQVPTDGLLGHWPFNGNANDESGNGNNGIVYNAVLTSDRFGNANAATVLMVQVISNSIIIIVYHHKSLHLMGG